MAVPLGWEAVDSELNKATSDAMWCSQCTCQGCTEDIMTANALCPLCRSTIQSTVTVKF